MPEIQISAHRNSLSVYLHQAISVGISDGIFPWFGPEILARDIACHNPYSGIWQASL
jgi:hypothetical protein